MNRTSATLLLALCTAGCSSKKDEPATPPSKPAAQTPKATPKTTTEAPAPTPSAPAPADTRARPKAPAPISKQEARARLDEWLKAQNSGDFALYERQYATGFTGIKRVRDKKSEYDRDGWLADRKRMFRKKMSVEASEVRLEVDAKPVAVVFVQTWSSGSFKDEGPKRLTLVRQGDDVLIQREEMLSSKVLDTNPARAELQAIDRLIGDTEAQELEVGMPGMSGVARRYEVDGKIVKLWDNISADHHDDAITIYLKEGKPFYASWDLTTGEEVEWDQNGGTAGKSRYVLREFLLSEDAITDAWERDKTFKGEYPSGAHDELMAMAPKKLSKAIGNAAYFDAIKGLAEHLKSATTVDYDAYESVRGAFDELGD